MKYLIKQDWVCKMMMDERWSFRSELDSQIYDHMEENLNGLMESQLWFQLNIQFRPELG